MYPSREWLKAQAAVLHARGDKSGHRRVKTLYRALKQQAKADKSAAIWLATPAGRAFAIALLGLVAGLMLGTVLLATTQ